MPVLKKITHQYLHISLLLSSLFLMSVQSPVTREYQVKAGFIFNFTQFVEWPSVSFSSPQEPLVIGVLGDNPFGSYLEEIVSGEKVNDHPLSVQYYKSAEEIKTCHVLFISLSDSEAGQVITNLKGKNILTVSDAPAFLKQGGMVRFFMENGKIRFQVNLEDCKAANLSVSSKLLRLAEIFVAGKK